MPIDLPEQAVVDELPEGTPQKVTALAEVEPGEDYSDELAELIEFLAENFVSDGNGNLAVALPTYDSEGAVPSSELAASADDRGDRDAVVVVNGELMRCTR